MAVAAVAEVVVAVADKESRLSSAAPAEGPAAGTVASLALDPCRGRRCRYSALRYCSLYS